MAASEQVISAMRVPNITTTRNNILWMDILEPPPQTQHQKKALPEEGSTEPMQYLWSVIIVTRSGDVLLDKKVVASDAAGAQFKADVHAVLKEVRLTPDDVTVLCSSLGQVKVWEKPQRVIVEKG